MLQSRVIPCLLLRESGLTKTIRFKHGKYIGDPINAVRIFNAKEVDELVFIDIDASKLNKEPEYDLIADLASECFMPISYGGGIKNLQQIERILKIGVEKVVINSKALQDRSFINEASRTFGSSTIIVGIDVKEGLFKKYQVYNHVTQKSIPVNLMEYINLVEKEGAGEIFINHVDREGTFLGFDPNLIKQLTSSLSVPLIICGGASKVEDFKVAIDAGASAVAIGSIFVYHGPHKAVLISYPERKVLEKLLK